MDPSTSFTFSPKNRSMSHRKTSASSRKQGQPKLLSAQQVIHRSALNSIECIGPALPVLVREALTFSEKSSSASVRVSNDGWAWFVCGRRLLVWQCIGEDSRRRPVTNLCRELSLPSSDLAYRADLVTIFTKPGNQAPSCIAASPEGLVRYWPSIAHEGSSFETNADLQGQECDSLTDLGSLGVVLATTTASIVLLSPSTSGGRPYIFIKPLRPPQGWLGGITRLIPSLIFGSLQSSHGMETKLVKVAGTEKSNNAWLIHVLAGHSLQQWLLVQGELQTLIYECHVTKIAIEAFHKTVWESCGGTVSDIIVWLLDLQPTANGVCVLLGATNPHISPQFFYGLGTLTGTSGQPNKFDRFCPVKPNLVYRESDEAELLHCRMIVHGNSALLYSRRKLYAVSALNYGEDVDILDFVSPLDEILGASLCRGVPILFTKEHGLFSITPSNGAQSQLNMSVSDVATVDSSSLAVQMEPLAITLADGELEELESSSNIYCIFKAAYFHYLRKNNNVAERLVNEVNPLEEDITCETLGSIIVRLSLELIDSPPVADPRWVQHRNGPILGSASLQISTQLEDKMKANDALVSFLKWSKLWDKIKYIEQNGNLISIKQLLAENREKLVAMYTLKQLHNSNGSILDQCIRHVIGSNLPEGLSANDIFYTNVSNVESTIQAIAEWSEVATHSDRRPHDTAAVLYAANEVILKTLDAVLEWRNQYLQNYVDNSCNTNQPQMEYLPWTATSGSNGLRDCLTAQQCLTLKYGARATGELSLKSKLYHQLLKLSDIILDGWRAHVSSVKGLPKYDALSQQYEAIRANLIKPLISDGEYERATVLGEKYLDFQALVQICELTDNMERLDGYCNTFIEQNFSNFLFNWYISEGKPGHLLERFRSRAKPSQQEQLSQFLGDHPSLSWVQDVLCQDLVRAYSTLENLAIQERDLIQRKKTMLSLSKLCLLASHDSHDVAEDKLNDVDAELEVINHQEDLPTTVLLAHGYDVSKLGVLSPPEIIKLYISEQNELSTESDFKKALDLLNFVPDDLERSLLKHSIWCAAVLRDSWTDLEQDAPIDSILNILFFKLVELLECLGYNLDDFLPPVGTLLEAEELGDLRNDRQFQYLLRLGYEHFQKMEACG